MSVTNHTHTGIVGQVLDHQSAGKMSRMEEIIVLSPKQGSGRTMGK
ncbi:MAG: hypothetical protein IJT32_02665 [Lachnospiraceae bacterium]|nr:hypothetical protein [Lachnospiraceae bacterium]